MELPRRKRNRLKNYDYSSHGAYFVTICTEERKKTLCDIVGDGFPVPKRAGQISETYIGIIENKYPQVQVRHYVVMPNHIHLLLFIDHANGTGDPSPTLGSIIGWYKYSVTKQVNAELDTPGNRMFQRSYHDHIIRNEQDYLKIWNYIEGNPLKWSEDCFYVE